jgi:pseudouridine kinase
MIMVDGSLTPAALETVTRLARQYELPLCADPSSSRLADKLRPHLGDLHLVVPNEKEAAALADIDFAGYGPDASLVSALELRRIGVETAIVTMMDFGIVYATSDETGHIPARYSQMVDSTGTGDAVTAAIMFGLINNLPAIEAIRLGAAAASLTLQSNDTVVPNLSLDMLYDHLIV